MVPIRSNPNKNIKRLKPFPVKQKQLLKTKKQEKYIDRDEQKD
jgi:hypothetical protein